jgi:hypothetical protein
MRIQKMSAANASVIALIIKLLNENHFRGVSDWFFSHSTWRDSTQQLPYLGTKVRDIPWIDVSSLVNEYLKWQEDPKLALDFISDPDSRPRYIGHMLCRHLLEHGSVIHANKKNTTRKDNSQKTK